MGLVEDVCDWSTEWRLQTVVQENRKLFALFTAGLNMQKGSQLVFGKKDDKVKNEEMVIYIAGSSQSVKLQG